MPRVAPQLVEPMAKDSPCQTIHADGAVAQVGHGPVDALGHVLVLQGRRADDDGAPRVPQTTSLQKSVAASTKAAAEGAVRAVSATCPKNDSTLKQMSPVCPGGRPG